MERGGSLRFSVRRFLTPYVVRPTHVNRTEGEGNEKRKERPNLSPNYHPQPHSFSSLYPSLFPLHRVAPVQRDEGRRTGPYATR